MKAAILTTIDKPLVVGDVKLTDLSFGQVLVRNLMSGICGAQLLEISGFKGNANFVPHLLGHEGCGIVEKVGPGVSKVKPSDKVVLHWRVGGGVEADFPKYMFEGNEIRSGKVTTLSEFSIVSENRLTPVPQSLPSEFVAMLGCSLTTAFGVIDNEVDLKFGQKVAVIGIGGVGLNLIQAAKLKGASKIIAVETVKSKESLALSLGATHFYSGVEQITEGVDIIIDTTGRPEVIKNAINKLSDEGQLILVGQTKPGENIQIENAINFFKNSKTVKSTQGGLTNPTLDIPRYVSMFESGLISYKSTITNFFELDQINEAFELLRTGTAGRIMIKTGE